MTTTNLLLHHVKTFAYKNMLNKDDAIIEANPVFF